MFYENVIKQSRIFYVSLAPNTSGYVAPFCLIWYQSRIVCRPLFPIVLCFIISSRDGVLSNNLNINSLHRPSSLLLSSLLFSPFIPPLWHDVICMITHDMTWEENICHEKRRRQKANQTWHEKRRGDVTQHDGTAPDRTREEVMRPDAMRSDAARGDITEPDMTWYEKRDDTIRLTWTREATPNGTREELT